MLTVDARVTRAPFLAAVAFTFAVIEPTRPADEPPMRTWRLVDGRNWQVAGAIGEDPSVTDRFEAPNRRGEEPVIVITFVEAMDRCAAANKRLCTEDDWTFACEGLGASPYPYGFTRDAEACVIDHEHRPFDEVKLARRTSADAERELDRLWQGEPSGSRAACRSPFGVYDLTGNVDEWTVATRPGRRSILKGGYWGRIRARCRPSTRAHGEDFFFYQQGYRCCADAPRSMP